MRSEPARPRTFSPESASRRRAARGRAGIAAGLLAFDLALVLLSTRVDLVEHFESTMDVILLTASAIVGLVVLSVVVLANVRAARGLAAAGLWLAILRIVGLVAAITVVAVATEPQPDGKWSLSTFLLALAIADALVACVIAAVTSRGVRRSVA